MCSLKTENFTVVYFNYFWYIIDLKHFGINCVFFVLHRKISTHKERWRCPKAKPFPLIMNFHKYPINSPSTTSQNIAPPFDLIHYVYRIFFFWLAQQNSKFEIQISPFSNDIGARYSKLCLLPQLRMRKSLQESTFIIYFPPKSINYTELARFSLIYPAV